MKLLLQGQKTPMNAANVQDGDLKKGDYSYGTVQVKPIKSGMAGIWFEVCSYLYWFCGDRHGFVFIFPLCIAQCKW